MGTGKIDGDWINVTVVGTRLEVELDVGEKVTVIVDGAMLELVVGESVTVNVVVFVLAVAIGENVVEEDEFADTVAVVVMFAGTEIRCLSF
jgi:hypothetical protein